MRCYEERKKLKGKRKRNWRKFGQRTLPVGKNCAPDYCHKQQKNGRSAGKRDEIAEVKSKQQINYPRDSLNHGGSLSNSIFGGAFTGRFVRVACG